MSHISGEVCIVTGAARGLGAAFATAMRNAGATVVTCDVLPGADHVVDIADAAQVKAFVDAVTAQHGPITLAVLNAGVCRFTTVVGPYDTAADDFDFHVATNLRGTFLCGRAILPGMVEAGRGNLIIIGTDHLCRPDDFPYGSASLDAYDASKWGLMGLVNAWANAVSSKGVRVNSVSMGATDSDMLRSFTTVASGKAPTQAQIDSWMRPADVAQVLVDLVEEGPAGRTSANIPIILGRPIRMAEWVPAPAGSAAHPYLAVDVRVPTV